MIEILFLSEKLKGLGCPLRHPSFNFVNIRFQISTHIPQFPQLKDQTPQSIYFKDTNFINFTNRVGSYTN